MIIFYFSLFFILFRINFRIIWAFNLTVHFNDNFYSYVDVCVFFLEKFFLLYANLNSRSSYGANSFRDFNFSPYHYHVAYILPWIWKNGKLVFLISHSLFHPPPLVAFFRFYRIEKVLMTLYPLCFMFVTFWALFLFIFSLIA